MNEAGFLPERSSRTDEIKSLERKTDTLIHEVCGNLERVDAASVHALSGTAEGKGKLLRVLQAIRKLRSSAGGIIRTVNFGSFEYAARQLFDEQKEERMPD